MIVVYHHDAHPKALTHTLKTLREENPDTEIRTHLNTILSPGSVLIERKGQA